MVVKLLMINPNTTAAMTELMRSVAAAAASAGTEIKAATGRFGGHYVANRATYAIAGHAALDAYAEHGADADVVLLACFGDPGLFALRELASQPVIGMAEASCQLAAEGGARYAIVTGGERWGPMLREFAASIGLEQQLAAVLTVAPTGADIARDPDRALDDLVAACATAVSTHGAERVILGGAGLAGLARRIQDRVRVPLIDSVEAIVHTGEELGRARPPKPATGPFAPTPATETTGLSAALATLLRKA
jgi:allantoin racemase